MHEFGSGALFSACHSGMMFEALAYKCDTLRVEIAGLVHLSPLQFCIPKQISSNV
jgi:hypothetical protein